MTLILHQLAMALTADVLITEKEAGLLVTVTFLSPPTLFFHASTQRCGTLSAG